MKGKASVNDHEATDMYVGIRKNFSIYAVKEADRFALTAVLRKARGAGQSCGEPKGTGPLCGRVCINTVRTTPSAAW